MVLRVREQRRLFVDHPAIDAVDRARRAQVRVTAPILDATQEQRRTIAQERGARVEHGVRGVRPVGRAQDRVRGMSVKQGFVLGVRITT